MAGMPKTGPTPKRKKSKTTSTPEVTRRSFGHAIAFHDHQNQQRRAEGGDSGHQQPGPGRHLRAVSHKPGQQQRGHGHDAAQSRMAQQHPAVQPRLDGGGRDSRR